MPESSDSYDAVCFGALNADVIFIVDKIPQKDEETYVLDAKVSSGGSAANTASALASFGNRVAFVGGVGKDEYGEMLVSELRRSGVVPFLTEGRRSGKAIVLVNTAGDRAILVDPGVNDEINSFPKVKGKILHLTSFVCRTSDAPFLAQLKAASVFDVVSLDPGMIYAERSDVWRLIEKCSIFLPNAREVEKITGFDYRRGAEKIVSRMKNGVVVVKLGSKGCYATDGKTELKIPAFEVKVIDTTGAGDAFNAGFLHAWLKGYSLEICMKAGNFVAAHSIQHYGARNFPDLNDLKAFLDSL